MKNRLIQAVAAAALISGSLYWSTDSSARPNIGSVQQFPGIIPQLAG